MLKIQAGAIKTLAQALPSTKKNLPDKPPLANASEIIQINRNLREAFGILPNPKNAPAPQSQRLKTNIASFSTQPISQPQNEKSAETQAKRFREAARLAEEKEKAEEAKRKKAEEQAQREERLAKEAARLAEEKEKAEEAKRKKAEEQAQREKEEKERLAKEAARLAEEKEKAEEAKRKKAEEQAQREKEEKEKQHAQQEKIRAENRRRLELLEQERQKKIKEELEQERQKKISAKAKPGKSEIFARQEKEIDDLPTALQALLLKLHEKKEALTKKLPLLPTAVTPLEQKLLTAESKISMIKNSELATILEKEKNIEDQARVKKNDLAQTNDPEQEKEIKKNIWDIEDRRKKIEKQRWAIEDRINKMIAETETVKKTISQKNSEFDLIKQGIAKINQQEKLANFVMKKNKLEKDILRIIEEKERLAPLLTRAVAEKNNMEAKLNEATKKEDLINAAINAIEEQERKAQDPGQKRGIERSRWSANEELKSIVQTKWEIQEKLKNSAYQYQTADEKNKNLNAAMEKIQSDIAANEISLGKEGFPVGKIRDSIRKLFEENDFKINQDILNDIVQIPESSAIEKKINHALEENKPERTNISQGIIGGENEKEAARLAEEKEKAEEAKRKKAEEQAQREKEEKERLAKEAFTVKQEHTEESLRDTVAKTEETDKPPQTADKKQEKIQQAPESSIKKQIKNETPFSQEIKKIPEKEQKKDIPLTAKIVPHPDKQPQTEIKKTTAETKQAQDPGKSIPAAANTAFYREKIDSAPATHIRTFSREQEKTIDAKPIDLPKQTINNKKEILPDEKPEEQKLPVEEKTNTGFADNKNLQNRWNQVKKNTIPTAPVNQKIEESQPFPMTVDPKSGNKNLARMLVILILAGILGIILVIALSRNNDPLIVKKPGNSTVIPVVTETEEPDTFKEPLTVISTITIYTEDANNIPNSVYPYLKKDFETGGYYGLLLQNRQDNAKIGLRQFFEVYKINAPSILYSALDNDFTLFIYSENGQNRIGFLTKIINSDLLNTALSGWEGSAQQDTSSFFNLMGRKTQTNTSLKFIDTISSSGISYQTMNFDPIQDNFSLAWSNYKEKYFLFSTSNNSLTKLFDQLPK